MCVERSEHKTATEIVKNAGATSRRKRARKKKDKEEEGKVEGADRR